MQLTPGSFFKHQIMKTYQPVTIDEVTKAYETLIRKAKVRMRVPAGFRHMPCMDDPAVVSLLPVGCDGMTTIQVERSEAVKERFFCEIVRMFNEEDRQTGLPKFRLKRFSIQERKEKRGEEEKIRTTVLLCLRDQVAMRVLLNRLTQAGIVEGNWSDMYAQVAAIRADLDSRKGSPVVIKTDISEFHPSVDRGRLIELLQARVGDRFDERIMQLLHHAISGHSSADKVRGLPLGLSISVILAEFYAQQMALPALVPGVSVYRYADDIVFIADEGTDAAMILSAFDRRLSVFGLRRNEGKTKVVADGVFDYLGVAFNGTNLSVKESGLKRWSTSVWAEVGKDIESHRILAALHPDRPIPDRHEIIRNTFKEYKRGGRSSYWKFVRRVQALNQSVSDPKAA